MLEVSFYDEADSSKFTGRPRPNVRQNFRTSSAHFAQILHSHNTHVGMQGREDAGAWRRGVTVVDFKEATAVNSEPLACLLF